jgi:hypothetical protein
MNGGRTERKEKFGAAEPVPFNETIRSFSVSPLLLLNLFFVRRRALRVFRG